MSQITFSQAMQRYLLAVGARHLSAHTISDYANTFKKFTVFLGDDIPIENNARSLAACEKTLFLGFIPRILIN